MLWFCRRIACTVELLKCFHSKNSTPYTLSPWIPACYGLELDSLYTFIVFLGRRYCLRVQCLLRRYKRPCTIGANRRRIPMARSACQRLVPRAVGRSWNTVIFHTPSWRNARCGFPEAGLVTTMSVRVCTTAVGHHFGYSSPISRWLHR